MVHRTTDSKSVILVWVGKEIKDNAAAQILQLLFIMFLTYGVDAQSSKQGAFWIEIFFKITRINK